MKMMMVNTPRGLMPYGDDDFEQKSRLKLGGVYTVDIKVARNVGFHRKYFAMISYAWEFLNENEVRAFITKEGFRKSVEVAAGHYQPQFNIATGEYDHVPKSIAFSEMDETAFNDLYGRVKDVIFSIIGGRITEEEFERLLLDF